MPLREREVVDRGASRRMALRGAPHATAREKKSCRRGKKSLTQYFAILTFVVRKEVTSAMATKKAKSSKKTTKKTTKKGKK
jgi:hypothetical protein